MNVYLFLIVVVCTLEGKNIDKEWKAFKAKYGKSYSNKLTRNFPISSEDTLRKQIYVMRKAYLKRHNERFRKGTEFYRVGINHFADMTDEEMKPYYSGNIEPLVQPKATLEITSSKSLGLSARKKIPKHCDWRAKGKVTPVKNQKKCGSCWAFATCAVVEAQLLFTKNINLSLSEQQLIDCAKKCRGCKGGTLPAAYEYIMQNGITSDANYVYTAKDGTCYYKPKQSVAKIRGFARLGRPDERLLAEMVAIKGPVAICFDPRGDFRYMEPKEIYFNPKCSKNYFSHAVLLVGYGTEKGKDYWLLKNSWGSQWGDNGYFKMARNRNNHCGIASKVTYPLT